jgi:hypothetical protein
MNANPTRPSNKDQRPGAPEDPKQNMTGHKAEYGQDNHLIIHERKQKTPTRKSNTIY